MTEINIELIDEAPVEVEFGEVTMTGGGSVTSYKPLTDKPQINGITLIGNKSFDDLGLTTVVNTEVDKYVADHKEELKGDPGTPGHDGDDGFSPVANIQRVEGGAVITIVDKSGESSAMINDGQGGSGSTNYNDLLNKPKLNGVELVGDVSTGNKTFTATVNNTRLVLSVVDDGNEVTY